MKFLFFAHYMPDPCGAFFHDIALAKDLQKRGHIVTFVTAKRGNASIRGNYRGIPWVYYTNAENEMRAASVWFSPHFPFLWLVRRLNERFQKPIVITMHFGENTESIVPYTRSGEWAEFLWIVSNHICEHVKSTVRISPSFKTVEPVRPVMLENEIKFNERGVLPTGDCITLINANVMKGLELFVALAARFPDKKFLGVRPYYNLIKVPEKITNIEWMDIQDDVRNVLRKTRILLVPSMYESWGRVAFEAMYNGIPVIYSRPMEETDPGRRPSGSTDGMDEWIDDSGFKCRREDIEEWVSAIQALDDPEVYKVSSSKAYDKTYAMDIFRDMDVIERKVVDYGVQFAPKVQTTTTAPAGALTPGITQTLRMTAPGSGRPFHGGRFVVRR
jgi:glycosyltransferase involved in cell wall biosynthesis